MQLSTGQLEYLCQLAIHAAKTAAKMIESRAKEQFDVLNKTAGDTLASQVFTEVDLKSQEIILAILLPSIAQFDLGLLAEESADEESRLVKDYFWCIDPLDGTLPFIEQVPGYSVVIALVSKSGEPVIGVICNPQNGKTYHAIKGCGAFIDDTKFVSPQNASKPITLITDRSFGKHPDIERIKTELRTQDSEHIITDESLSAAQKSSRNKFGTSSGFSNNQPSVRKMNLPTGSLGGAAMNACWMMEQNPAIYLKYPKSQQGGGSLWDYAASACIVQEAGYWASDIHGNPLDLNRLDSTFMNHRGILFATDERLKALGINLYKEWLDSKDKERV